MSVSWTLERMANICVYESASPCTLPSQQWADKSFWSWVPGTWHKLWEELNTVLYSKEDWKPFMSIWQVPSLAVMSNLITLYVFPFSCEKINPGFAVVQQVIAACLMFWQTPAADTRQSSLSFGFLSWNCLSVGLLLCKWTASFFLLFFFPSIFLKKIFFLL